MPSLSLIGQHSTKFVVLLGESIVRQMQVIQVSVRRHFTHRQERSNNCSESMFGDSDELFPSAHSLSEEILQGIQQGGLMSLILVRKADDVTSVSMSNR